MIALSGTPPVVYLIREIEHDIFLFCKSDHLIVQLVVWFGFLSVFLNKYLPWSVFGISHSIL